MAIYSILSEKIDSRKNGQDCVFNGYLEDYLSMEGDNLDPVLKNAFAAIQEKENDVRIVVDMRSVINRDAISNQIIRYKDIFKLTGKPLVYPYILYFTKNEEDPALLVVPYTAYGYILAKGMYYCMTEPGSEFIDCKNEIVAVSFENSEDIVRTFEELSTNRAGAIQRRLDNQNYENYEVLKEAAIKASQDIRQNALELLTDIEDRTRYIYDYVVNWFLLKKVLYVQYMVNKNILKTVHDGDVRKQRNQAKTNADEVEFLSYSEMWRIGNVPAESKETEGAE